MAMEYTDHTLRMTRDDECNLTVAWTAQIEREPALNCYDHCFIGHWQYWLDNCFLII